MMNKPAYSTNSSSDQLSNLDRFLEEEKNTNAVEPWCKLDKTDKLKKLLLFADKYKQTHGLTEEEAEQLVRFFRDCLDKKKLYRVKEVTYNRETGEIIDIPALLFHKSSHHFTLKNMDKKRVSTLKGLAPKKQATIKNMRIEESDSD